PEGSPVPAIRPERPATRQELVHVACDPNSDALHAARQIALVPRLNDEVQVIPLDGEVEESETPGLAPGGAGKSESHRRKHMLSAQTGEPRAQRHVDGLSRAVARADPMRDLAALR